MKTLRRVIWPVAVFATVWLAHFLWSGFFPEQDPAQDRWAALAFQQNQSWLRQYLETGGYWLGYSYALSLAFAAVVLRLYWEERTCGIRNLAVGGITFSGILALMGCFLAGCCGSPMLIVYLNLFGASFLPIAKPMVAALTTITILGAWWWLTRTRQRSRSIGSDADLSEHCCDYPKNREGA